MIGLGKPNLTYKGRMETFKGERVWLIWSNKWGAWYRPNSSGYTKDLLEAGLYSYEEAARHFVPAHLPRHVRVTEPFPLSCLRWKIRKARRKVHEQYLKDNATLDRLERAMIGDE